MLARRVQSIALSPTLAVNDLARRLRAQGVDVLDLSAGEPDFPTPDEVKCAGKAAIDADRTRYTATAGVLELREAIAARLAGQLGLAYGPDEIIVSPGAKASLHLAFQALLDPGDEVLVPTPYWSSYPDQIRLAEGVPVFVDCPESEAFKVSPARLEAAVSARTKALILNYPNNPTGACLGRVELEALAAVAMRHDLWIVADEIYSQLLYDGVPFASIAQIAPEVRRRTILIDGLSKTYSMTGWRVGYAAAPREVVAAMVKIQSHCTSHATTPAQWASVTALGLDASVLAPRLAEFARRREAVVRALSSLPGVRCRRPDGAFYAFPNVEVLLGEGDGLPTLRSAEELTRFVLEQARVALVPGEAFGAVGFVRLSYAVAMDRLEEGLRRLAAALDALAPRAAR